MTSLVGAVITTYFPLFGFFVEVEEARVVKEEGPASVDYASVSSSITSESPVAGSQKERTLIAVNLLDCTAYVRLAGLVY